MGGRGVKKSGEVRGDLRRSTWRRKPGLPGVPSDSKYALGPFAKFCLELRTESNTPLKLESFQRRILKDHFAGVIEEVVVIPKKNGKSTLFAALALFHLEVWPEAEVVIGASSRDQATILFNQAANMIRRSNLEDRFDIKGGYRHIRRVGYEGSHIRVLPADAKTVDGVLPTLALVDELHRHPNGDLYGVFRDGLDARNGRMVTMSTAGLDQSSPLGILREKASQLPSYYRKGTYSYAQSEDGSFTLHEWSLEDTDDLDDMKLVKKANPASWQTLSKLKRRKNSPAMTPARWARFACGIWTEGEDPWIEPVDWDRLEVDIGLVAEDEPVWITVDVGVNSAIAIVAQRPDGGVAVRVEIFDGELVWHDVEQRLIELAHLYSVQEITYDNTFDRSAEELRNLGLPMEELPFSPLRMSQASVALKRVIAERKLRHDGDKRLRAQVLSGVTKETERGWRLVKSSRNRALIALAIAVHQATVVEQQSVYETRDLGVFG